MGVLKDSIGAALGAGQVKNGFNGPQLPYINNNQRLYVQQNRSRSSQSPNHPSAPPPPYVTTQDHWQDSPYSPGFTEDYDIYGNRDHQSPPRRRSAFRPVVLPQITYGDGQPFLRAYSDELAYRGISEHTFISIVDQINVAVIPNPEVQIFQHAAKIAGYFVPGAASLGIIGAQIVVGIGTALGHASLLGRALAKANLEVFLPQGLEICIGTCQNIDAEVGLRSNPSLRMMGDGPPQPQDRIVQQYGQTVAPVTTQLPQLDTRGRRDPLACIGNAIVQKNTNKKTKKHEKKISKGKEVKSGNLDEKLSWLMVREAKPDTLAHWRKILQQSEDALRQEAEATHQAEQVQHDQNNQDRHRLRLRSHRRMDDHRMKY